jgi:signal transduction histidine kinase
VFTNPEFPDVSSSQHVPQFSAHPGNSDHTLTLESTLQELPLDAVQAEASCAVTDIVRLLERYPLVPGVLLYEQRQFAGMVSRQRLHDFLLRSHATELFWHHPFAVLHSYAQTELLILDGSTPILAAAQQALRRSRELLGEPIVVVLPQGHYLLNIHDLYVAYWQIRGIETQVRYERSQVQMIQTDKMASLGRLVDGLLHELLDPVSFIWGNLAFLTTYTNDLLRLFAAYKQQVDIPPSHITALQQEIDLDFLQQDLPRALESIHAGAKRLTKLATSLQNFCHIDDVYPKPADLHDSLDGILLLLKSQLTTEIQIVRHYGKLPPVTCFIGQINQVFMNILSNAVEALLNRAVRQQAQQQLVSDGIILDRAGTSPVGAASQELPCITITTAVQSLYQTEATPLGDRWVSIQIRDNGPGIPPDVYQQILESFSVERRAAKETSLARSYQIITARHGGVFQVRSQPNVGTEFEILLPL